MYLAILANRAKPIKSSRKSMGKKNNKRLRICTKITFVFNAMPPAKLHTVSQNKERINELHAFASRFCLAWLFGHLLFYTLLHAHGCGKWCKPPHEPSAPERRACDVSPRSAALIHGNVRNLRGRVFRYTCTATSSSNSSISSGQRKNTQNIRRIRMLVYIRITGKTLCCFIIPKCK